MIAHNTTQKQRVKGFSLLELLVVLAILTVLAGTVLVALDGTGEQARYSVTQQQYMNIRRAVIGVNSISPESASSASGFIADIGGRPTKISHLLINPNTDAPTSASYPDPEYLVAKKLWRNVGDEVTNWPVNFDTDDQVNLKLMHGWRGPYLEGDFEVDEDTNTVSFYDAWGNNWDSNYSVGTLAEDPPSGDIQVFSSSKDQTVGNSDDDQYSVDYPASDAQKVIAKHMFEVDLAEVALPSLEIENILVNDLLVGLVYPGIDLNSVMNDPVDGWHQAIITYNGTDPVEIPQSATTTLNSSSTLRGDFGGHPAAYRYQIVLFIKSVNNSDTLAEQIVAVYPDVFIFIPRHSFSKANVIAPSLEWKIN